MNRESATIIILPITITARLARALLSLRVIGRPEVLPDNVVCFSGAWHRRGRSDDPLRKPMPSEEIA